MDKYASVRAGGLLFVQRFPAVLGGRQSKVDSVTLRPITRRKERMTTETVEESAAETLTRLIGETVQYYDAGWRYGKLVKVGAMATIEHPVTGKRRIPIEDVREA